jgi:hypothetical protein
MVLIASYTVQDVDVSDTPIDDQENSGDDEREFHEGSEADLNRDDDIPEWEPYYIPSESDADITDDEEPQADMPPAPRPVDPTRPPGFQRQQLQYDGDMANFPLRLRHRIPPPAASTHNGRVFNAVSDDSDEDSRREAASQGTATVSSRSWFNAEMREQSCLSP